MPHSKMKSENYQNLGGMNVKASPYITGPFQFLDITNMDFQTPGSLTKRWGTTQYIGLQVSVQITGLYEYEKLNGLSRVVFSGGSHIYAVEGTSYLSFRSSFLIGFVGSQFTTQIVDATSNLNFVTFADQMFATNGRQMFRYDGNSSYIYGLPYPFLDPDTQAATYCVAGSSGVAGGLSGRIHYALGYVNNRGYYGPPSATLNAGRYFNTIITHAAGATSINGYFGPTLFAASQVYAGHGITAVYIARAITTLNPQESEGNYPFYYLTTMPLGTTAFVDTNIIAITLAPQVMNRQNYGLDIFTVTPEGAGETFAPKYLEIFNNRMFLAGFSTQLSSFYYSNLGDPEAILPENQIEVRTNDGDLITGVKAYNGKCYFFKQRSFHALAGDAPENYQLNEVSDQYGCVSDRAICIYNDTMLFLDRKGVCKFNGAALEIISTPVQSYFDGMNYSAALNNATIIHDKQRNQILIGIPYGAAATTNNITIVYDYLLDAWTKYDGYNPGQYAVLKGRLDNQTSFFYDYNGRIHYTGASFFGDNGSGYTTYFKSRFIHDLGESVEKQFRRLFLNFAEISGSSLGTTIGFYTNFGSSNQLQRTIYANPFQTRTDFGLSAKSLAFECAALNASLPLRVHGFTIEYRFQRAV